MKKDKIRKFWLSSDERKLLSALERGRKRGRPKSKSFTVSKKRADISQRLRQAIRDRPIGDYCDILLLDGKPLRECTAEVRKAFLIQCQIKHFYIWDAGTDIVLSATGRVHDLPYPDQICPKCFRFTRSVRICEYCGAKIDGAK